MAEELSNSAKGLSIGFIMDGNGRWAKKRGLPRTAGHVRGAQVFQDMVRCCSDMGVDTATFYAFSTENWSRPKAEVTAIMNLMSRYLEIGFENLKANNRIRILGEPDALPDALRRRALELEEATRGNTGMHLNVAINYGGREEIVRAARMLAQRAKRGEIDPEKIDEAVFSGCLYTAGQKDPDFILRPSGEKRLSNFLLWQCAYAEFIYMDVLWPDFTKKDLEAAVEEYHKRNRRFGGV